jgi:hypothetical protein
MSNDDYQQYRFFCEEVKAMKEPRIKIDFKLFPGVCFGITFPMQRYTDMHIVFLCIGIYIKWRKR